MISVRSEPLPKRWLSPTVVAGATGLVPAADVPATTVSPIASLPDAHPVESRPNPAYTGPFVPHEPYGA